jgi:hypothetical protein
VYLKAISYKAHDGYDVNKNGFKFKRRFYIFKKNSGDYVTLYSRENFYKPSSATKDLSQVIARIDQNTSEADKIASNKKAEVIADQQRSARARAEFDRKNNERLAKERAYQKSVKAHNAKVRRMRRQAAWSGVSEKIDAYSKKEISDSKARTKCIRKRAQSKNAYARGKQNWYYDGGCN